jgi:hypothetical protein
VQGIARFMSEFYHMQNAARSIRNELFARTAGDDFRYFDYLYGYKGCAG